MPRLAGLQLLRALAAGMVLVGHCLAEAEHYFGVPLPGDAIPWTRGVDIFFVISGFIVTLSAQRWQGRPGAFLWRRALRVVPLYYIFTTLMVAALLTVPGAVKDTALDPAQILGSYAFFPVPRPDGRIAPVLSLGWTLNYEMLFYGLCALGLLTRRPLLATGAMLVGLAALGRVVDPSNPALVFWTNPLILEFLMGAVLALAWRAGWRRADARLAWAVLAVGLALLVALDPLDGPRWVLAGLPAAVIVASATLCCPDRALSLTLFGDASYALYLSHRFVLRLATLILLPLLPAGPWAAMGYVGLTVAAALMAGLVVHLWLERPLLRGLAARPGWQAVRT